MVYLPSKAPYSIQLIVQSMFMLRPNEVKVKIGINDSVSVSFLAFFRFQSFLVVFYVAGYTVEIPPPR